MTRWKVLHGDCLDLIPVASAKVGKFHLIFADPPFNIGQKYTGYQDDLEALEYELWTDQWVSRCWDACRGVLCLHGPDRLAELYLKCAERLNMRKIAWINWHYRFGQCGKSNWIDARCHCLIYSKSPTWTWNPSAVLVDSDRAVKYNDPRTLQTEWPGKRLPGTVWGIESDGPYWGRVQGTSKERCPVSPNQLPEVYLERIIKAYTNPGDVVLDPFAGSGTTATVAVALGRNAVTIDVSEENVRSIEERIRKGPVRL